MLGSISENRKGIVFFVCGVIITVVGEEGVIEGGGEDNLAANGGGIG